MVAGDVCGAIDAATGGAFAVALCSCFKESWPAEIAEVVYSGNRTSVSFNYLEKHAINKKYRFKIDLHANMTRH